MNCKEFEDLSHLEKVEFIGKLNHAAMSSSQYFKMACQIIQMAEKDELYTRVTILPEEIEGQVIPSLITKTFENDNNTGNI